MQFRWPVLLASASPRRQELMRQITDEFSVDVADVDETPLDGESPWQTAERLADEKAKVVFARNPGSLIVAGDTVVALSLGEGEFEQLAKPDDSEHAENMLRLLSGKEHLVITGVCVLAPSHKETFAVTTRVRFRQVSDEEIRAYVATGEPMDKAGAYAIQGGAKGFVESYEGSLTNVIGFPVDEIRDCLTRISDLGTRN